MAEKPPQTEQGNYLQSFNEKDVDIILGTLAMNAGNISKTVREVKSEFEISVHPNTVRSWRYEKFPKRYAEAKAKLAKNIDKDVANNLSFLTVRGTQAQEDMFDLIEDRLKNEPDIPLKELAPALRNIAQAQHLNIQQRNLLEERPTSIVETRTVEKYVQELEDEDIIIDAEVVSEEDATV